ncbi:S-adenosyl-L-methionine-dependent methyltransferase [Vararia minispora EC-137]|uniref:S-adenosyl-L-methionine-dependent methyltransferase n=1 Tax=Vararia minispora EC-137 TaxID=1314806 RepID=A0ACB8QXU6_9AGAM|nr:S-adenosyl-L-methionine-dependent methyltransferase [Vararia minispora EC-137]
MTTSPPTRLNINFVLNGPPDIRRYVLFLLLLSAESDECSFLSRQSEQYVYLRSVFDHTELLPPTIETSRVHRVLDVGAGTGVWALDFTDLPAVRPRLAPNSTNPLEIYICDVLISRFPPSEILHPLGIRSFQQDVTQPFPNALHGTFDLVHMSSMAFTLNENQWQLALRHVCDVLKPGGYLILVELDPISYTPASPPPPDGRPHDVSTSMMGGSALSKINCVLTGMALKSRFYVDLSYRFPSLLQAAGLQPVAKERAICPYGTLCNTYTGLRGTPLHAMRNRSTESLYGLLDSLSRVLMQRSWLEVPLGVHIQTEDQRRALLNELRHAVTYGVLIIASEWVVQRPIRHA